MNDQPEAPASPAPTLGNKMAHLLGSFNLSTGLALFSAILAIPAFCTAGVEADAVSVRTSGTSVLKEPYIEFGVVRKEYAESVPRAVEIAVKDFNEGTTVDLEHDTQDYQRRYSPQVTCDEAKASVESVYGSSACRSGSQFYKISTQYERGLMVINERRDPATSHDIRLDGTELALATRILRRAVSDLVACVVTSREGRPINVTVSPASGYNVQGEKTFTLAAKDSRRVILKPEVGAGGAIIGAAGCTVDYDLATQAKNAATPRWFIALAGVLALASVGLGLTGRLKGWKND